MAKQIIEIETCYRCSHSGIKGRQHNPFRYCTINNKPFPITDSGFIHNPCPKEQEYLNQRKKDFEAGWMARENESFDLEIKRIHPEKYVEQYLNP